MQRIHYSAEPLVAMRSIVQTGERYTGKPDGFWYSVGTAWRDWCKGEEFGLDRLKHATAVDVDLSRILVIDGMPALEAFAAEYDCEIYPGSQLRGIGWKRVAERYAGVEINPYLWPARLEHLWYYGWDCASGCVWDAAVVRIVGPLRKRKATA